MNETEESRRMISLDVLRGLDMIYLVSVATFLMPLLKTLGMKPDAIRFFCSHPWEGFAAFDIIMPLFIFMCGAAMPFALGKRLDETGRPTRAFWLHVLKRFALLWFLGLVAQGRLLELEPMTFSPFNNTLQTIAVGYLLTAAVMCIRPKVWLYAITALLPIAYAVFMACGADYGRETNIANLLEMRVLALICPDGSMAFKTNGYTWFATIPMFGFMTLCGYHATNVIRSGKRARVKVGGLAVGGALLLAAGLVAESCGIPCIKHVFTFSFTLQAMGWCVLLLDALYLLIDVLGFRRGWWLALLFGQTSLFAYMLGDIFAEIPKQAAVIFAVGLARRSGETIQPVVIGVVSFVLTVCALFVWREYRRQKRGGVS